MDTEEELNEFIQGANFGEQIVKTAKTDKIAEDSIGNPTNKDLKAEHRRRKQYVKTMVELAKDWDPYDGYHITRMVGAALEDLYDYYKVGINVWQADESRFKTLADIEDALEDWKLIKELESPSKEIENKNVEDRWRIECRATQHMYKVLSQHILEWWD